MRDFNPFANSWKAVKESAPLVTMDRIKEEKEEQPDVMRREFHLHALENRNPHPSS